jgi:hypothetical protein
MKNEKNLYLLIFLVLVSIISMFIGLELNWSFNYTLWAGLFLLGIALIAYFLKVKKFKWGFGVLLLFGVFNAIQFTPFKLGIQFYFLEIQVIPTFFLLLFIYLNRSRVLDIIQDLFTTSNKEQEINTTSRMNSYKKYFQNLSDKEIENKLNKDIVPEAKNALIEIIKERSDEKK